MHENVYVSKSKSGKESDWGLLPEGVIVLADL
jgi:hypothetical protein